MADFSERTEPRQPSKLATAMFTAIIAFSMVGIVLAFTIWSESKELAPQLPTVPPETTRPKTYQNTRQVGTDYEGAPLLIFEYQGKEYLLYRGQIEPLGE